MQYPVPQFTEVEDRLIGPLTLKQFLILAGAGVIVFVSYSSTKSIPLALGVFALFGLPAIGVAFGKLNGRPLYKNFMPLIQYAMSPKFMVFHKEAIDPGVTKMSKAITTPVQKVEVSLDQAEATSQMKKLNYELQKQIAVEDQLVHRK
jgi:hypothetical protein